MTVKEFLQRDPLPDTPVGIYEISDIDGKPLPLFLGDRLGAIECRYAAYEVDDSFEAYYEPAKRTGIVIYITVARRCTS